MQNEPIYKVIFTNQDKVYEIYARGLDHGALFGFIEVEELVFGERSEMLVDPAEEKLQAEFKGVRRTYIPVHSVIRIDEVEQQGKAKITDAPKGDGNVKSFPVYSANSQTPAG